MHTQPGTSVIGVMLDPPALAVDRQALLNAFGAKFPIVFDDHKRWATALVAAGLPVPSYVFRDSGHVTEIFAPHAGRSVMHLIAIAGVDNADRFATDSAIGVKYGNPSAPVDKRQVVSALMTPLAVIADDQAGSLQNPGMLAADAAGVYVYDYGDDRLKAFSYQGAKQWSFGDPIQDQAAFVNPTDLKVDQQGHLVLVDLRSRAVTVVTNGGQFVKRFTVPVPVLRAVPASDGSLWGFDSPGDTTDAQAWHFSTSGQLLNLQRVPADLRGVDIFSRQSRMALLPKSDSVVVVYSYSDQLRFWTATDGLSSPRRGIEQIPFPPLISWRLANGNTIRRVSPNATHGARSVTADDRNIYVLFNGASSLAGRLIDIYSRGSGRYVGTYVLPHVVIGIAASDHGLVTIRNGSRPAIELWRVPAHESRPSVAVGGQSTLSDTLQSARDRRVRTTPSPSRR